MKSIYVILILLPLLTSCHSDSKAPAARDDERSAPASEEIEIQGDPYSKAPYAIPVITDPAFVKKALSKFKIAILNGHCEIDPKTLIETGDRISFDGENLTFEVKRGKCTEIVKRRAKWDSIPNLATLFVSGGILEAKCPDSGSVVERLLVYGFQIDQTLKYVVVAASSARGCWWAKRID